MGRTYEGIDDRLTEFLTRQPVFFVATAPLAADGHINLSPKGLAGSFAVLDEHRVAYLDLTGSGVETIAHVAENGRIVLMFCAFDGPPRIVRLHGRAHIQLAATAGFDALASRFPTRPGMRSIIEIAVERIADSCGYGVPQMQYQQQRDRLEQWAIGKGDEIPAYWSETNAASIDGLPGITS
jgi:hypothetical protein